MRAICESCAKPQPVDWRAGDLCVHCGHGVREERRCFWCARYGPKAKFCRKCGAAAVDPGHYGPARMLKHMGASVFEIPKLLLELDPELIATHRSIYGTHAAAANRHVDDVRWLQQFLYQQHWSTELEEELIPLLPWSDDRLAVYAAPARDTNAGEVEQLRSLCEHSPFVLVKDLAHLARIHTGDFQDLAYARHLLGGHPSPLQAEAALQFSDWRALYATWTEVKRWEMVELLKISPLPEHAGPRLRIYGEKPSPYPLTDHPDTAFLEAIAGDNVAAMERALASPDPLRRYVAAKHLIRLGHTANIGPVLRDADTELQTSLLHEIKRYKQPVPALHDEVFRLVGSADRRLVDAAGDVIALSARHADSIRLLEETRGNPGVVHALLHSSAEPETLRAVGEYLVRHDKFDASQFGMSAAAKPGRMPDNFVEEIFPHAAGKVQSELVLFAEKQIEERTGERTSIERWLIRQCIAPQNFFKVNSTAWSAISRYRMHRNREFHAPTKPFPLTLENILWCWNVREFLKNFTHFLDRPELKENTLHRDDIDRFLYEADEPFYLAAAEFPDECHAFADALQRRGHSYATRMAESLLSALASPDNTR